jgi:hypothetical protein
MYEGPEGFFHHDRNYLQKDVVKYCGGGRVSEIYNGDFTGESFLTGFDMGYETGEIRTLAKTREIINDLILFLLRSKLKIRSIKLYRDFYGCSLREAKDAVDFMEESMDLQRREEDGKVDELLNRGE